MENQNQQTQWEVVNPTEWKPTKDGEVLEGILRVKKDNVGVNKSTLYTLEKADRSLISIWGSTILDEKMAVVQVDEEVRITFVKREPNKRGQMTKIFKVERAKK